MRLGVKREAGPPAHGWYGSVGRCGAALASSTLPSDSTFVVGITSLPHRKYGLSEEEIRSHPTHLFCCHCPRPTQEVRPERGGDSGAGPLDHD